MVTPKMLFWGPKIDPGGRAPAAAPSRGPSGHVRGTPIVGRLAELINGNLWGESTTTGAISSRSRLSCSHGLLTHRQCKTAPASAAATTRGADGPLWSTAMAVDVSADVVGDVGDADVDHLVR